MTGFTKEHLEAVRHGQLTHAAYPTAEATLCGVLLQRLRTVADGAPSCPPCASTARAFRQIDHSAPADWFLPIERS